jgi:trans-2,3-dihydro-3-hydroxyanthranilate isomerase
MCVSPGQRIKAESGNLLSEATQTMSQNRRHFLQTLSAAGAAAIFGNIRSSTAQGVGSSRSRRYQFVQIDVFTSKPLEGNPLSVFPDARGLSDKEMQDLARETNLQETTFVLPRDPNIEQERGIKVRIFVPGEEIPFGGHPTLGTAMVLRNLRLADGKRAKIAGENRNEIVLDLQVGKVPVDFREDGSGNVFGEMHQVEPVFGPLHDRETVAGLLDLKPSDIAEDWPIQTVSTGLPFAIVPLKHLDALRSLRLNQRKISDYLDRQEPKCGFYYITRETKDPQVGLRSRSIYTDGEDPATGSAAGCTAAWMVRNGIAKPEETVHILQGVEIKRPSHIYVRAGKQGEKIGKVRVGGYAVEVMRGEAFL